jgi:hypothetical protein
VTREIEALQRGTTGHSPASEASSAETVAIAPERTIADDLRDAESASADADFRTALVLAGRVLRESAASDGQRRAALELIFSRRLMSTGKVGALSKVLYPD